MDFFFCIPVIFGCKDTIKQEGSGQAHICPRCHNAQVVTAKSKKWFELCWIPLIPMGSKHIFVCGICQWQAPQDGPYQPPVAQAGGGYYQPQQYGYGPPPQGYPPK
ncbi:hypothetical protein IE53DRAFT_388811 [Violaceomyces palustris]|uniref:Uncharacterized protein n=1 Tax=Violaceomyces palustris TaxID=1673888 RepID=A0ACD0NT53_9BASI|nr:hypothetical protein IE53DRAFT_388811 [Violaceomyces palustris]